MKAVEGIWDVDFADDSLSGGFSIDAVVTPGILTKLKARGFGVSEIPPERQGVTVAC